MSADTLRIGGIMDQQNDLLPALALVLVIAMLAQFGLDYLHTHSVHDEFAKWSGQLSFLQW